MLPMREMLAFSRRDSSEHLPSDASHDADDSMLVDLGLLTLSSDHDSGSSFSVQCVMHSDGALVPVTLSNLGSAPLLEDDVAQKTQRLMRHLRSSPHRRIAPVYGVSPYSDGSGAPSLLVIEAAPSSTSLQSMILAQMRDPGEQVYSWKQAIEWLCQIASALVHLHASPVATAHGNLSARAIYVTSALDVCLGRCLSGTACSTSVSAPALKQRRALLAAGASCGAPPAKPAEKMSITRMIQSLDLERAGCGGRQLPGPPASPFGGFGCPTAATVTSAIGFAADAVNRPTPGGCRAAEAGGCGPASPPPGVSSAELPGVGVVMRVCVRPGSRSPRAKTSPLWEAAEATVWGRSAAGIEQKQHGGDFFTPSSSSVFLSNSLGTAGRAGRGAADCLQPGAPAPLHVRSDCGASEASDGALTPLSGVAQGPRGAVAPRAPARWSLESLSAASLDAADTEHVLLDGSRRGCFFAVGAAAAFRDAAEDAASVERPSCKAAQPAAPVDPASPGGCPTSLRGVYLRAVAAPAGEARSAMSRRHSTPADAHAAAADAHGAALRACKRSRQGALPSLVELPNAEAAGDADRALWCARADGGACAFDVGSAPLFGAPRLGVPGMSSLSEPGERRSLSGGLADAAPPGRRPARGLRRTSPLTALTMAQRSTCLSLARDAVRVAAAEGRMGAASRSTSECSAAGNAADAPRRASGALDPPAFGAAARRPSAASLTASLSVSSLCLEDPGRAETRQRGSASVAQLLEVSDEAARDEWAARVVAEYDPAHAAPPPSRSVDASPGGAEHAGLCHDDDLPYAAPEVLAGGETSQAADVFAFGIVAFEVCKKELLSAQIAMRADRLGLSDAEVLQQHRSSVIEGGRPRLPLQWPCQLQDLVQRCWQVNAFARPSMAAVLQSLQAMQARCPADCSRAVP